MSGPCTFFWYTDSHEVIKNGSIDNELGGIYDLQLFGLIFRSDRDYF